MPDELFLIGFCVSSLVHFFFFFSSRRRHTRWTGDWSSDVCSSDLCVGSIYLDSDLGPAPTRFWVARRNRYIANNRACSAGEEAGPTPVSGIGVAIVGAGHVRLIRNVSNDNVPSLSGALSGGIVVMSGASGGPAAATHTLTARNGAPRNAPADIVWDGTGSNNRFRRNRCGTSTPDGFC